MAEIEMTAAEVQILQKMLERYDGGHVDEFTFNATFGQSGFAYSGAHAIDATRLQMLALRDCGFLRCDVWDDGSAGCSLNVQAARKVMRQVGAQNRQNIFHAIYDLTQGGRGKISATEIAKRTRLDISDVHAAISNLCDQKFISAYAGDGGPIVYLEPAGVREIEKPNAPPSTPHSVNINQLNMHGSAFTLGNVNKVNVQMSEGLTALQAVEMLKAQSADAVMQMDAVQKILAQVIADVKDGKDKGPGWREMLLKLIESGGKFAEFGSKLADLGKLFPS